MDNEPVAIIGVALVLPGAHDLAALHENLRAGRVAVAPPGADRVRFAGGDPGTAYASGAYVDRIDLFDHAFFGLARREAELMDPHQRLTLQLVHRAVENACHAPGELRGSRTAVVLSAPDPGYAQLVPDDDPQRILGTLPSATAARVAYLLDLAGPGLVVDTACSGSLAAVALAVQQLRAGQAELAIAGGVSLQTVLRPRSGHDPLPGIESPDAVCRPFDTAANGTVGGEGGGILVLKPLFRAVADRDHIHAVLRGVAVNHNGYRATGMSAPSRDAQAEVIGAAWQDAGVPVTTAGYVECHGSGTPLGDAVEAAGLRRVLEEAGAAGEPLPIGAVKGNVGHLDHAAGMAGLFKVLAGLRHTTLYPTPHFTEPHPLLGAGSPLCVNDTVRHWPERREGEPRRAGISSFGLTGTNVHVVVEEARPGQEPGAAAGERPAAAAGVESGVRAGASAGGPGACQLVVVSAVTPAALDRCLAQVGDFAARTPHALAEVAHALNRGRDHHRHRVGVVARDTAELADALRTATVPTEPSPTAPPLVLLCSGDASVAGLDEETWRLLSAEFPVLTEGDTAGAARAEGVTLLVRQYGLNRLAHSLGLDTGRLVGSGPGNLAVQVARGRLSPGAAREQAAAMTLTDRVDEEGLLRAVRGFAQQGAVLVELGGDGVLSRRVRELAPELPVVPLPTDDGRRGVLRALGRLYELGVAVDWNRAYDGTAVGRVEVPTYPFEPVSCWYGTQPDPVREPDPEVSAAPAGQDTERAVAEIWHRVLDAPGIGPDANYFDLGGTSIAGITLLREAQARFGARITFADLYRNPTVRQLAALIDRKRRSAQPGEAAPAQADGPGWTITAAPRRDRAPLSHNQEQLWYLDRLLPPGPLYNIPGRLRYRGQLDADALGAALHDVTTRHEVLRTRVLTEDGLPCATFDAPLPDLIRVDLRDRLPAERERAVRRLADVEARTPFHLGTGPLLRTTLVALAEDDHVLLCTWHHIVFDGWSPAVFFRDLAEYYAAHREGKPAELRALPVQYSDFAVWQRERLAGGHLAAGLRFWRAELADLQPGELPLDRPRPPVPSYAGDLLEFSLDQRNARRIREFCRSEGVTTFVTMLAAVNALLHLWAGHRDVIVGAATSGRGSPASHALVGYFNNVLPFRTPVDGHRTFRELVRRTADTVTGVLDHEEVPFGRIVADLNPGRDPSRHPLYTVCYTHQNTAPHTAELTGLTVVPETGSVAGIAPGTSKVDLTLGISDETDGPMPGYLEYAVDLFDRTTMEELADRFLTLVVAAVADPDRPLTELVGPRAVSPAQELPRASLVTDAVRRFAARHPQRPAVVHGGTVCGYGELDRLSERLADRLRAAGVGPDTVVPVLAPRGVGLVVGWLGVLKVGGAFAPLDPAAPLSRLAALLADLDCRVLVGTTDLTAPHAQGRTVVTPLPADPATERVDIPDADSGTDRETDPKTGPETAPEPGPEPAAAATPTAAPHTGQLAYVAFTSGSTGAPHGCAVGHGALANLLSWFGRHTGLRPGDRMAQAFAPGFDGSVLEILAALAHGVSLHLTEDTLQTPAALLRQFAAEGIAVACLPTPLAELVLDEAPDVPGLALRVLATGGDRLRVRPPEGASFRLLNMYGPTECAVVGTCEEVKPNPAGTLPGIGGPITGAEVYVLGPDLQPVPPGRAGELYLGGAAVGRGYHGLPGLTATRFVVDPRSAVPGTRMYRTGDVVRTRPDGTLDFLGRADDQVEIRGHRIEPAEVERALLQHPRVQEAVVVAQRPASGATRLVAHVAGEPPPTEADLLARLARRLPAVMVPDRVVTHRRLPRTANGKLARAALADATAAAPTSGTDRPGGYPTTLPGMPADPGREADMVPPTPSSPDANENAERILARIWTELLGRPVGPEDDFFASGGDSVLSVAVASRAERAGLTLTPHDLLTSPTLRELAARAASTTAGAVPDATTGGAPGADTPFEATPAGPIALTPLMHAVLEKAPDHGRDMVVAEVLETAPGIRGDAVAAALARLVELHEPLRYRLRTNALGHRLVRTAAETSTAVDMKALPLFDDHAVAAVLEADKTELAAAVDPVRGTLLRARFYDRGPRRTGILLLAVHHFAYDHVSAVPLLEELNSALRDPEGPAAHAAGTGVRRQAWRHWTAHLRRMAQSDELSGESGYWRAVLENGRGAGTLPDRPTGPCTGTAVLRRTLPSDQVAAALTVSGPGGQEAAAAAVASAWSRWRGQPDALVLTVGAGTPNAYRPDDRSSALGWFTSAHPVLLPVRPEQHTAAAVPTVAEILRSVPNDGVGYGILRHLSPDTPATSALRALPEPEILVEHTATGGDELRLATDPVWIRSGPLVLEQNALLSYVPVVVTSAIAEGALEIHLVHDDRLDTERMGALADCLADAFAELAGQR
ncbi:non-ribosomal peptide synthetase [Streptomyces uncialis]|uniref:non-ribosomal peptide synthetase n=1 Tax=Streptomyces uncialis TaxID=1048205 RepID=UPI002259EC16|nr:non-ribosomal peptide synthetase [Streptomyces uncialis]MCX4657949.1 amino acid adenylation domain-containing protein [Streptomyces uncialis]